MEDVNHVMKSVQNVKTFQLRVQLVQMSIYYLMLTKAAELSALKDMERLKASVLVSLLVHLDAKVA